MGDTVRRATGPWTPAVHALLRHLETAGFEAAPCVLGVDDDGREVLSFIEGEAVGDDDPTTFRRSATWVEEHERALAHAIDP